MQVIACHSFALNPKVASRLTQSYIYLQVTYCLITYPILLSGNTNTGFLDTPATCHACAHLMDFDLATSSAWTALSPDMPLSFFACHFFSETYPDHHCIMSYSHTSLPNLPSLLTSYILLVLTWLFLQDLSLSNILQYNYFFLLSSVSLH